MKVKAIIIILFLVVSVCSNAQDKSSYQDYSFKINILWDEATSYSSEYYDGKVWFFMMGTQHLLYHPLTVNDEGKLKDMDHYSSWSTNIPEGKVLRLNTVVFNQKLYVLYYNPYYPSSQGCLWFARITETGQHSLFKSENLNFIPNHKMAAVAVKDTLFLYFAEKETGHLKYFRGVAIENSDEIQWLSDDPTALTDSIGNPLKSVGNVAACTYFTIDNKERIMLAYPGEKFNNYQNHVVFYSGDGNQFIFHHQIASFANDSDDWSAYFVSLAQGTVKGGWSKQYMMQAAYVTKGDYYNRYIHIEMFRHEFSLTTYAAGGWEHIPVHGGDPHGPVFEFAPDFMEYYIPDGNAKEIRKYLYLVYCFDLSWYAQVVQWDSDLLKMIGHVTEFCPDHLLQELGHLICVVEGPPPFVLNGHTMMELYNANKYPPSSFIYGQETTHTVGSNTEYKKSFEASGGFGPITSGFKRAMQHNNHNSDTDITTMSVITTIKPPLDSLDSKGLMISFYDAPSLKRSQWRMHDYNGDTLNTSHNLFLFNFVEPQLKIKENSFTEYVNSPKLDSIYSYEGRNVEYFSGLETFKHWELLEDIGGGVSQTQTLSFDTLYVNTTESSKTIKVGIDAKYKIFSASADYTVDVDYSTENKIENNQGYQLTYNNPAPKVAHDTANVLSYNTIAYVMNTVDSSAYFLPDGFKHARPIFVTWEVTDIQHGVFYEYIDNKAFIEKYSFNCFPNPASSDCYFTFDLRENSNAQLILYDALGHYKEILLNENIPDGHHNIEYSVENLTPGLYFYKLQIGHDVLDGKLMVIH